MSIFPTFLRIGIEGFIGGKTEITELRELRMEGRIAEIEGSRISAAAFFSAFLENQLLIYRISTVD